MRKRRGANTGSHAIGGLFTFALFALFVLLSLLLVAIGANGYQDAVDAGESVGQIRTTLGYVAGKVRSGSSTAGVEVREYDGLTALVLSEVYECELYETIIYHQDGALYEAYIKASETDFDKDFGSRLTDVAAFTVEMKADNLLQLTVTADSGETQTLHIALRNLQGVNVVE